MDTNDFLQIKEKFNKGSVDEKIKLYTTTVGLTKEQYRELLTDFPIDYISQLEKALS